MFKFGNIARQKFVASNLVDTQISATTFMLKSSSVRSPGIDTTPYGAELYHVNDVGVGIQNPYSSNFSHYYNGSVNRSYTYLENNLGLTLGSGNWTIECWVRFYETSLDNGYTRRIIGIGDDVLTGWHLEIADNNFTLGEYNTPIGGIILRNNSRIIGTVVALNDGLWHHIAFSKVGAVIFCYADGVQQSQVIFAYNLNQTGNYVVARHCVQNAGAFEGYISNIRLVSGTGLYSGNRITVPTSKLSTVTNCIALFNHRAAFNVDESMHQQRVAVSGDPVWQHQSGPFVDSPDIQKAISLVYRRARNGYSVTLPDGRYRIGSSDFNIEFWFKPHDAYTNTTYNRARLFNIGDLIVDYVKNAGWDSIGWSYSSGASGSDGPRSGGSGNTFNGYQYHHWNHIVLARTNGWCTVYVNGVLRGTVFNTANILGSQILCIGTGGRSVQGIVNNVDVASYDTMANGNSMLISDLRIVVGHGLISSGTNFTNYTTSSRYIPIPTSPINTNTNWRGLLTSTNIVFAGFGAEHIKNNKMPINIGDGFQPVIVSTLTNVSSPANSTGDPRIGHYSANDYGGMGTFTPFGTHGWSGYFTATNTLATSDVLSLPLGALGSVNSSTGVSLDLIRSVINGSNTGATSTPGHDFTVECWFMTSSIVQNNVIFDLNLNDSGLSNLFVTTTGTQIALYMAATNATWGISRSDLGQANIIKAGIWYHLAVVKNTSTVRLYLNGSDLTSGGLTYLGTWTGVTSYTANQIGRGAANGPHGNASTTMTGFISNVRILVGQALYTGNFIPAVNRPLLLTQDQSFNQDRLYYPTDSTGGSIAYMAGASATGVVFSSGTSIMAVPTLTSNWNTSTWSTSTVNTFWHRINLAPIGVISDWTVEFWIYPESFASGENSNAGRTNLLTLITTGTNNQILQISGRWNTNQLNSNVFPRINISNAGQPTGWTGGTAHAAGWTSTSGKFSLYKWQHVAVTRYQGAWGVYLNGNQIMNITTGSDWVDSPINGIILPNGYGSSNPANTEYYQGMISNVRIIQGQAIYTGTFTVTNVTFTTSTIGMSGVNISQTLTGLVVFLGAQDNYGGQGFLASESSRRLMAVINSGTLINSFTSTQHVAITTLAGVTTIYPRHFGPVGCMPSVLTLASKTFEDLSRNTQTVRKGTLTGPKLVPFAPFKTPTAHNPEVNGGSYYFNGATVLLTPGGYSQNFGTKDFTMETWVYLDRPLNNSQQNYGILDVGANPNGTRIMLNATGAVSLRRIDDTVLLTSPYPILHGGWYHIAWTRYRGVGQGWINGKSFGTYTDITNYASAEPYDRGIHIGAEVSLNASLTFQGYIASTRIVNDYALYHQEFTPPTRIHPRTTNTFFLCNFNNYQVYDPSQKNNISLIGDVRTLIDESPYARSWSYNFDGKQTGNWIATDNSDIVPIQGSGGSLQFGSNNFTFEGWFNILELQGRGNNQADTYHTIIDYQRDQENVANAGPTAFNSQHFKVLISSSGTVIVGNGNISNSVPNTVLWGPTNTATTHPIVVSSWTHIAVVRETGITKIFINGYNVRESADTNMYNSTSTFSTLDYLNRPLFGSWGRDLNNFMYDGYMSNVRIVKGLAVYTTSSAGTNIKQFIPSLTPLTTVTNSSTNIRSVPGLSVYGMSQWFTSSTISTNNFINTPISSVFDIVTAAFTVEGWAQYHLTTSTAQTLFSLGTDASNRISLYTSSTFTLNFNSIVGGIHTINLQGPVIINTFTNGLMVSTPGSLTQFTTSSSSNRWFHWAVTKDGPSTGGNIRLFVNGKQYGSPVTSASWFPNNSNYMAFGFDPFTGNTSTGHNLTGHLSNVRVVKGQALYTGDFYPPTNGYIGSIVGSTGTNVPAIITGTISLIAFNTQTLTDLSGNNISLATTGATQVDPTFGPFSWEAALLTFNNRELIDVSANSATITLVNVTSYGTPKPAIYQPFPNYNTPETLGNRSLFFTGGTVSNLGMDGTNGGGSRSAYIKIQEQPHLQFSEGPFTIELWFLQPYEYRSGNSNYRTLISKGGSPVSVGGSGSLVGKVGWWLGIDNTAKVAFTWGNNYIKSTTTPTYDSWHHLVVQRENTGTQGLRIFLDGVLEAVGTMPQTVNTTTGWAQTSPETHTPRPLLIGMADTTDYNLNYQWIGFMDDIRLTTGLARYANTTTIIVPTAYNNER